VQLPKILLLQLAGQDVGDDKKATADKKAADKK